MRLWALVGQVEAAREDVGQRREGGEKDGLVGLKAAWRTRAENPGARGGG